MKLKSIILLVLLLIIAQVSGSDEQWKKLPPRENYSFNTSGKPMKTMLNVNDFTIWHWASGTSGLSANGIDPGGIFPRGTAPVIFTEGLIWGGFVNDTNTPLRLGGVTYREGVKPGRILPSGQAQDPDHPEVRIYRIHKNYKQLTKDELRREAAELRLKAAAEVTETEIDSVYQQYETDWREWPAHLGAPFYDLNGNGIYEPETGESPGLYNADQVIWYVCNDLDDKSLEIFGAPSIGLEIQVTAWAYASPQKELNATLFRKNRLINKGAYTIDSMFVGLWSDADIGRYTDDFAGCDSLLDLAYVYNGSGRDAEYDLFDLYPPAVGYIFVDARKTPATSFGYTPPYTDLGDPCLGDYDCTLEFYNWLNGFLPSTDLRKPIPYQFWSGPDKGKATKFPLSGDPVTITGDVDGQGDNLPPRDQRILLSSGPVKLLPGDTLDVIDARVGGYGAPFHPYAVEWLKLNVKQIKGLFPNYISPDDLPVPVLDAIAVDGKIQIGWGSDPDLIDAIEQESTGSSFRFEGYNIWQLPRANAPLEEGIKIASTDLPTPPDLIMGYVYDPATAFHIRRPLILGNKDRLQRFVSVERDSLNQRNFYDGQPYHFAVTAYYYSDKKDLPWPVLESRPGYITIHAQAGNPGYTTHYQDTLQVTHTGRSNGKVSPVVVTPSALTGHTYQVSFTDSRHWTVTDITDGVVKAMNQTNLSGDYNYPVIDGIMPVVTGSERIRLSGWESDDGRWVSGVNWGGQEFFGGLDVAIYFFGSTIDTLDLVPVRLIFQDSAAVASDGLISKGAVYRRDQGYAYAGTGQLPFAAYDMLDPDVPRRLNICFIEDDGTNGAAANAIWDMGWDGREFPGEIGAREYIFIMNSDYDEGAGYSDDNWGPASDVLFTIWPKKQGDKAYLDAAFYLDIKVDLANTPEDLFTYTSPVPAAVPNRFRVYHNYPNPFNSGTTIRYWLPAQNRTRLEIFDIRGRRVTTPVDQIQDQGEYYFYWQPGNISSGIYFCRLTSGPYSHLMKITLLR